MQIVVTGTDHVCVMECATTVIAMERVAMTPIPIIGPTSVAVPPSGVVTPVPRAVPSVPAIAPEPVIDHRPIDIYRFDHIVRTIDVLVTYNLYFDLLFCIFLNVDGGYVLEYILREDCL